MWRQAIIASARAGAQKTLRTQAPIVRRTLASLSRPAYKYTPVAAFQSKRRYSSGSGLNKEEVQGRVMDLLKNFDKVTDVTKLQPTAHFTNDLGFDSLDTVEVVMAIEEEFSIEIPDKQADAIQTVEQAVSYIMSQPDAH